MMLESVVEGDAVELAEARGWLQRKVKYQGRHGAPDRWFFKAGVVLIVEFKRPGGRRPIHQRRELDRLRAEGFEAHYCDSIPDFAAHLDRLEHG